MPFLLLLLYLQLYGAAPYHLYELVEDVVLYLAILERHQVEHDAVRDHVFRGYLTVELLRVVGFFGVLLFLY